LFRFLRGASRSRDVASSGARLRSWTWSLAFLVGGATAACTVYDQSLAGGHGEGGGGGGSSAGDGGTGGRDETSAGGAGSGIGNPGGGGLGGSSSGGDAGSTPASGGAMPSSGGAAGWSGAAGNGGASGKSGAGGANSTGGAAGKSGASGAGGASGASSTGGASGAGGHAGASSGTAGNGVGGSGQGGNDAGVQPVLDLIDDMEDGDLFIPVRGGRNGSWFISSDMTAGAVLQPASTAVYTMGTIAPARGASTRSAHVQGQGFKTWGAVIGVKPRADNTQADGGLLPVSYDASGYCGVHYFAMGSGALLRMDIPDKYTNPAGGICNPNDTTGQTACFDHFGMPLALTASWTEYTVSFASLHDRGVSAVSTTFHPEAIFQIEVSSRDVSGAAFDIWIDDIAFIPKPTSGACP
jgi:hypothetical protein